MHERVSAHGRQGRWGTGAHHREMLSDAVCGAVQERQEARVAVGRLLHRRLGAAIEPPLRPPPHRVFPPCMSVVVQRPHHQHDVRLFRHRVAADLQMHRGAV